MKIGQVKISNFATLKDIEVNFNDLLEEGNKVIVFEAVNERTNESNGVGKSAFFEAIFWCLTGKSLRGVVPQDPSVTVEILRKKKDPVIIKRSKNDLQLFVGGIEVKDLKTNLQKEIDDILGVSHLAFQMLTYFSTDTISKWFVSFTDTERKDFFTDIIGLEFIDSVLEQVKGLLKSVELKMSEVRSKIQENESLIFSLTQKIIPQLQEKQRLEEELKNYLEGVGLEADISKLEEYRNKAEMSRNKWKEEYLKSDTEIRSLDSEKRKNLSLVSTVSSLVICPTCLQSVPSEHKERVKQEIEKKIQEIDEKIKQLQGTLVEAKENYSQLEDFYRYISNFATKYASLSSVNGQSDLIEDLNKRVEELNGKLNDLTIQLERYKILSDIFSPKGLKAAVIDHIIKKISERMYAYSSILNLPVKMETQKGKLTYTLDYKALSSGQRRRLEIAFLFALRSFLPSPFDYIVIDEIFDHLDYIGVAMANEIIKEFLVKNDILVFVVSHRRDIPITSNKRFLLKMDREGNVKLEVMEV